MLDQRWDDEAGSDPAQGCAWVMTAVAPVCVIGVVVLVAAAAFGLHLFASLVEARSA
ncbi:hypothetical protein ACFWVP_23885 [Streptomyces sp. NPDC058637]|uniref:hypothetical protein n=1 Tax=Streptomyces sp. NPDC058637 TaxID=3346569 RepID=UPI003656444A